MIIMTSPPIPSGQVTAADLFSEITAARREIGQVLGQVAVIDARYQVMTVQLADHETRIRAAEGRLPDNLITRLAGVEKWQWKAAAVISTLAAVAGLLSGYLGFLLGHFH